MKHWTLVVGVLFLAAGAWLWQYPPSLPKEREVLRVGDWRATLQGRQRLPGWIAPMGVGFGGGLLLAGLLRRR